MPQFTINNRVIGDDQPVFIIAEVGINHNGDINKAREMIDVALEAGVDAVKFQTFKADEFVGDKEETYTYTSQGKDVTESMYEMFKRYEFTKEQFIELSDYCKSKGIVFFSTPQNVSDLNVLLEIGVPCIKVGSDDLTNIPLMKKYVEAGLPMIISTGMSYLDEVGETVLAIYKQAQGLGILHCVSSYPTQTDELNLKRIRTLKEQFPFAVIGFSDHSIGSHAAVTAVSLGAKIFEKHFTLDHNLPGPDHRFSADPKELKELVQAIRDTEVALGEKNLIPSKKEEEMRLLARRSIAVSKDLDEGHIIQEEDLTMMRPGTGLMPREKDSVIGRKLVRSVTKNELIDWKDLV